jgi:sigma-B regulation protein RsbU (phosphoserine phosphatase)
VDQLTPARLALDLLMVVGATVLASLALEALALFSLRQRRADRALLSRLSSHPRSDDWGLLSFAAFAALYAIRLLLETWSIPLLLGDAERIWIGYTQWTLTYVLPVPMLLFAEQVLGPGWLDFRRHLRRIGVVFAVIELAGMPFTRHPGWANTANDILVLATLPALGMALFEQRAVKTRAMRWMRLGVLIAAVFVVAENLQGLGVRWLAWPQNIEFIGFVAFFTSLAYAVTERFLDSEGRLIAVDRELETARRIQHSILPRDVPIVEGFRMSVRYLPMTAVAGDFYDFFVPAADAAGVLVADVSGHGVPAALIASMIKVAASSHRDEIANPGRLLTLMNRTLDEQLGGQFATAICAHVDRRAGVVSFAGAGHPPIYHWRAGSRDLAKLESTGMMIGPFPGVEYDTGRQPIGSGDRLVLYTDGLLEATAIGDPDRMFGDDQFPTLLRTHADRSGAELADIILRELTRWSGKTSSFDDDVTLVIVDVL